MLVFLMTGAPTLKLAIKKYYDAVGKMDTGMYISACYPVKWQKNYKPEQMEVSLDEVVENALSFQSGATFSDLKIIKKEKVDDELLQEFNDSINRIYGFEMGASKMYKVTFSMTMHLEDVETKNQNTGFITRYVYKCGGRWFFFADTLVQVDIGLD